MTKKLKICQYLIKLCYETGPHPLDAEGAFGALLLGPQQKFLATPLVIGNMQQKGKL